MRTRTSLLTPALLFFAVVAIVMAASRKAGAELAARPVVAGEELADAEIRGPSTFGGWRALAWEELEGLDLKMGRYDVRVRASAGYGVEAIELPVCNTRGRVWLDGDAVDVPTRAPAVVRFPRDGAHDVVMEIHVSSYEHRIACGNPPRVGRVRSTREGLGVMTFASPHALLGGGRATVFVPTGHDDTKPAALLVGTYPWSCDIWTYAAYAELLRVAEERDMLLLMPEGLGNLLYIAKAEDEVMRAIGQVSRELAVDPRAVSIWGASMGGAGATTIGFHHPDRFATITSYFGDSQYDVSTYVRSLLPDDATAHKVNALDIVDNARNVPVWLVHGEADHTSPIRQSILLYDAMKARGFDVRFDRVPGATHEGSLVARFLTDVAEKASTARVPAAPSRVTYWSVRPGDLGAYGVTIVRAHAEGDAYVDVELVGSAVVVHKATGVRTVTLARGALGTSVGAGGAPPAIVLDAAAKGATARWANGD